MPGTRPAPELPPGPRSALVVGTGAYEDPRLAALRSPARDAAELAAVLGDPAIGGFGVTVLTDPGIHALRVGIEGFLATRSREETVVVYLSCHGVLNPRRRLYFAASDTGRDRLAATALEARWLIEQLDECRARRQVVLLDCCFSGAFAGTKAGRGAQDVGLEDEFGADDGRGRTVLTASRATEYSFEGEELPDGSTAGSVFTAALVAGLRSGAADVDRDGLISVADAYAFVHAQVLDAGAAQTPQQWTFGGEGRVVLARSAAGVEAPAEPVTVTAPAAREEGILGLLGNPSLRVRLAAVEELGDWLAGRDAQRIEEAREALRRASVHDDPQVADAARQLLADHSPRSKAATLLDEAESLLGSVVARDMLVPNLVHMAKTASIDDPRRAVYLTRALQKVERDKQTPSWQRASIAEVLATIDPSRAVEVANGIEDDAFARARTLVVISKVAKRGSELSASLIREAVSLANSDLEGPESTRICIELAAAHPHLDRVRSLALRVPREFRDPQEEIKLLVDMAALLDPADERRTELLQRAEGVNREAPPWLPELVVGWIPVDRDHAEDLALSMSGGLHKVRAVLAVASAMAPDSRSRALLSAHAAKIVRALPMPPLKVAALTEVAAVLPPRERLDILAEAAEIAAALHDDFRVSALLALARAWSEVEE